jgi:hypothetical protein
MIQYGIYYGPINESTSTTYFTDFYNYMQSDSLVHKQVYRLFPYGSFEDITYNMNADQNGLISYVEGNKIINKNNSWPANEIYIYGYIDRLLLNGQLRKADSLLKNDPIIHSYSKNIDSNGSFSLFRSYLKLLDSNSAVNYFSFRKNYERELSDSSSPVVQKIIGDAIEYATFYKDITFADSLLSIFESIGYTKLKDLYTFNRRKAELSNLIKTLYVERSFITLYNATHNRAYLFRLLKFKLIKEKLIGYAALADRSYDRLIDSVERNIVLDKMVKDFKYETGSFRYDPDFGYFQKRESLNNEYIDSLLLETNLRRETEVDTAKILSSFFAGLDDRTVILLGVASRRRPTDKNLATYILVIENNLDSLKVVDVEDSIFETPYGNYFDVVSSEGIKRDRLRYFLKNVSAFSSMKEISKICQSKSQIFISGSAMIDQIPFNIILAGPGDLKKVYELGSLTSGVARSESVDFHFGEQGSGPKILCLGGAVFNKADSQLLRSHLQYLPGTFQEVTRVGEIFDSCCDVDLLTGKNATKVHFLHQIEKYNYGIIHIATHSFFVEFDATLSPFASIPVSILPERDARSAIYFTGGGDFQRMDSIKRLESYLNKNLILGEMVYLPLYNTKLVVLSSCETNIGLARIYEDVFGNLSISKAFRYAGARYVLGTQWEIGDAYALEFYKIFYDRLKACGSIERSFHEAVSAIKAANGDPMIWGCFTLDK